MSHDDPGELAADARARRYAVACRLAVAYEGAVHEEKLRGHADELAHHDVGVVEMAEQHVIATATSMPTIAEFGHLCGRLEASLTNLAYYSRAGNDRRLLHPQTPMTNEERTAAAETWEMVIGSALRMSKVRVDSDLDDAGDVIPRAVTAAVEGDAEGLAAALTTDEFDLLQQLKLVEQFAAWRHTRVQRSTHRGMRSRVQPKAHRVSGTVRRRAARRRRGSGRSTASRGSPGREDDDPADDDLAGGAS